MHTGPKSTSFGVNIGIKHIFWSRAFRSESSAIDEPESQIPNPFNFGTNFWALAISTKLLSTIYRQNIYVHTKGLDLPSKIRHSFHKICASATPFWESDGSVRGSISLLFLFTDPRTVYEAKAWILENFTDADFQTFLLFWVNNSIVARQRL